jgi:hypothetical protein
VVVVLLSVVQTATVESCVGLSVCCDLCRLWVHALAVFNIYMLMMEPRILPPTLYFTRELLVIATDQASTYRDFLLVLLVLLAVGCLSALTIAAPARLDWRVARLGGMWCAPGCASQGLHKANASGRPQSAEAARSGLLSREAVAQSVAQWEVVRVRWHVPAEWETVWWSGSVREGV